MHESIAQIPTTEPRPNRPTDRLRRPMQKTHVLDRKQLALPKPHAQRTRPRHAHPAPPPPLPLEHQTQVRTAPVQRSVPRRTRPPVIVHDAEHILPGPSGLVVALALARVVVVAVFRPRCWVRRLDGGEGDVYLDRLLGGRDPRREQEPRGLGVGLFEGFTIGGDEDESGSETELRKLVLGVTEGVRWGAEVAFGG